MAKLINVSMKDYREWMESLEHVIKETYVDADRINKVIQSVQVKNALTDISDKVVMNLAFISSEFDNKLRDFIDLTDQYEFESDELKVQLESIKQQLKASNDVVNHKNEQLKNWTVIVKELTRQRDALERLISIYESNIEAISRSGYLKSDHNKTKDMSKENHPGWRDDVRNEDVLADYVANGYHVTKEMQVKYKMSNVGLIDRLGDNYIRNENKRK